MSDDLILRLSNDRRPVSRLTVARRLALGLGLGALGSTVLTGATIGFRADMMQAAGEAMLWVNFGYTLALAGLALWACERLARPAGEPRRRAIWLALPLFAIAALAGWRLAQAPALVRMPMVMGSSADVCPWCILTFSMPPLAGLIWAVRGLAPTRLRLTGLMLGLTAGGCGRRRLRPALHRERGAFLGGLVHPGRRGGRARRRAVGTTPAPLVKPIRRALARAFS